MDLLIVIGVMAAWVALQTWILPRLGVPTCCCAVPDRPRTTRDKAARVEPSHTGDQ
jgi:hypothetical protein